MKKICKLTVSIMLMVLIAGAFIKSVPRAANYTGNLNINTNLGIDKFIQPEMQNYKLIVSAPEKGVFVYGKKIDEKPYFERVLVKTPVSQREFNWKVTQQL